MPPPSPPALAPVGQTAFALGAGYFVVTVGFVASLFVGDLTTAEEANVRALSFLLGLWSAGGLLAFGPGALVARRWWRKRQPFERRADIRAAVLAVAGLGLTIFLVVRIVVRTPALRAHLFGPPSPGVASLVINWDRAFVDRVTLE